MTVTIDTIADETAMPINVVQPVSTKIYELFYYVYYLYLLAYFLFCLLVVFFCNIQNEKGNYQSLKHHSINIYFWDKYTLCIKIIDDDYGKKKE